MSLHCPAILLLVGVAPDDGADPTAVEAAARALWGERIAAVYAAPGSGERVGATAAQALGLTCRPATQLDPPGGRQALADIADLHRGETVLVVADDQTWDAALPGAALDRRDPTDAAVRGRLGTPLRLQIGDDGWTLLPAAAIR